MNHTHDPAAEDRALVPVDPAAAAGACGAHRPGARRRGARPA